MKILLINIDSKKINIALKKIELYHQSKGDEVIWNMPLFRFISDKIYVSCIFTKNKDKCLEYENDPKCLIGGSGYDLNIKLPDEIETMKPKINIGFTTRGCIRNCSFCIVNKKEGQFQITGDIYDFWDGKSKNITILDNNILADKKHFYMICEQIKKENLIVDFNQGLDFRLLEKDIIQKLKTIKLKELRLSFDNIQDKKEILKTIQLLSDYNLRAFFYVLIGFNSTIQEDLEKINLINNWNHRAFAMLHENNANNKIYKAITRWCNLPVLRNAMSFQKFLELNYKGLIIEIN